MHKQTPKSCSCLMCKLGDNTKGGHKYRQAEQRSERQATKQALKKGLDETILPAQRGGRIG